ncbi:MAG TPA: hypothetical protein VGZ29_04015, partial [Terriglobia bacterium]|nr:hypothetical protein [Terriglobia bacterium]
MPARGNVHCTSTGGGCNTSLSFSSSTNRITNSGYSYDAAGHVACDGSYFYSWDADGGLASVATEGANCTAGTVLYNVTYYPDGHIAQEAEPGWNVPHSGAMSHDYTYDVSGQMAVHASGSNAGGYNALEFSNVGGRWLAEYN